MKKRKTAETQAAESQPGLFPDERIKQWLGKQTIQNSEALALKFVKIDHYLKTSNAANLRGLARETGGMVKDICRLTIKAIEAGELFAAQYTINQVLELLYDVSRERIEGRQLWVHRLQVEAGIVPAETDEQRIERMKRRVAEDEKGRSDLDADRFIDLNDKYNAEPNVRDLLMAYFEAKDAPEDEEAQYRAISFIIAELLDNKFLHLAIHEALTDVIVEMENDVQESLTSPNVIRHGLVGMLMSFERDALTSPQAKRANPKESNAEPAIAQIVRVLDFLTHDERVPEKTSRRILEALDTWSDGFWNNDTSGNPELLRIWLTKALSPKE